MKILEAKSLTLITLSLLSKETTPKDHLRKRPLLWVSYPSINPILSWPSIPTPQSSLIRANLTIASLCSPQWLCLQTWSVWIEKLFSMASIKLNYLINTEVLKNQRKFSLNWPITKNFFWTRSRIMMKE